MSEPMKLRGTITKVFHSQASFSAGMFKNEDDGAIKRFRGPFCANAGDNVTLRQGGIEVPLVDTTEPLAREAQHFIDCIRTGRQPISDGGSGQAVVAVLEHGQRSLGLGGQVVAIPQAAALRKAG